MLISNVLSTSLTLESTQLTMVLLCAWLSQHLQKKHVKSWLKEVKKVGENAKIAIRNIRRDAMDEAKKQEKDKEITEDQLKALEKDIQKATDDAVKKIDSMTAEKEKELAIV